MNSFTLERLAFHIVDRSQPGPQFAQQEFDLTSAAMTPEDLQVLNHFFDVHLGEAWNAEENSQTLGAKFNQDSVVWRCYHELTQNPANFFQFSREIAQRLHDSIKGSTASPGLLIVLLFHENSAANGQSSLGIFKMNPRQEDIVTLRQGGQENAFLGLAVQHIQQTLSDSASNVQKWAIIPHPTRHAVDVKVKDKSAAPDLTQYFVRFLGCSTRWSEKKQAAALVDALRSYIQNNLPQEDAGELVTRIVKELHDETDVTTERVVDKIRENNLIPAFNSEALQNELTRLQVTELATSGEALKRAKYRYTLDSGIIIEGSWVDMNELITLPTQANPEFRIRTQPQGYSGDYV